MSNISWFQILKCENLSIINEVSLNLRQRKKFEDVTFGLWEILMRIFHTFLTFQMINELIIGRIMIIKQPLVTALV